MSELFKWDAATFGLGVSEMDKEHQKLIEIMNRLYERHQAKATKPELLKIMNELATYTVKHFKDEEAYFDQIPGYTQAGAHKLIHQRLLEQVSESIKDYQHGDGADISPEFFKFLKVWLGAHICGVDKKYADVAHDKAV